MKTLLFFLILGLLIGYSIDSCDKRQDEQKFDARAMKGEAKYRALIALKGVER